MLKAKALAFQFAGSRALVAQSGGGVQQSLSASHQGMEAVLSCAVIKLAVGWDHEKHLGVSDEEQAQREGDNKTLREGIGAECTAALPLAQSVQLPSLMFPAPPARTLMAQDFFFLAFFLELVAPLEQNREAGIRLAADVFQVGDSHMPS